MAADNILRSYGDVSVREDVVMNSIEYLTARETQISNMLGKTEAISTIHSYLVDTLRAVSGGQYNFEEASDYSYQTNSTPTRQTNLIQNIAVPFKVSRTQQQIAHYTGENELQRQTVKAMWDYANQLEFELLRSTLVSGASGTAPAMDGIINGSSQSTNHTSQTSGTIFNTSILDGLMATNASISNGDVAQELYMGFWLRQKMDQSIQKSNVVVNGAGMTEIVRTVSTYTTAMGTLRVHTHRYIQQAGDTTGRLLAIRPDKLKVAYLINGGKPTIDTDLARSGDYDPRAIVAKATLEIRNKQSQFYADGFSLTS